MDNKELEQSYMKELAEISYDKFKDKYNYMVISKKLRKEHTFDIVQFSFLEEYKKIKNKNK